jgi:hypothetical protein
MTDSLRAKQNMEILDVFKDIHSQVVGLQNKQVQQFPETLKAKTQRDLGAEVNVDKAVENINKTIETKLGALEFVVQNINPQNRGASVAEELTEKSNRNVFYNSLMQVNNTGDVIPLWNSIVRAYQEVGVNRETQQMIKVKVQELDPNLDAMSYGLNQAIDTIFKLKIIGVSFAGTILDLLRTLSVYTEIKNQVESNPPRFEALSVSLLDRSFKNVFETQSADRLQILKEFAPRGLATSSTIRNIPDFQVSDIKERIKAIEDELGVDFSAARREALYKKLRTMSGTDVANALNEMRSQIAPSTKYSFSLEERKLLDNIQALSDEADDIDNAQEENASRQKSIREQIADLEEKGVLSDAEIRSQLLEVPEATLDEPVAPVVDDFIDFMGMVDDEAFREALDRYEDDRQAWLAETLEIQRIEDFNEGLQNLGIRSEAERQEIIDTLQEELDNLGIELEAMNERLGEVVMEAGGLDAERVVKFNKKLNPIYRAFFDKLKGQSQKNTEIVKARQKAVDAGLGMGQPASYRGLSSIKNGYGYQDIKIQKKKQMHFDDCDNDNYC